MATNNSINNSCLSGITVSGGASSINSGTSTIGIATDSTTSTLNIGSGAAGSKAINVGVRSGGGSSTVTIGTASQGSHVITGNSVTITGTNLITGASLNGGGASVTTAAGGVTILTDVGAGSISGTATNDVVFYGATFSAIAATGDLLLSGGIVYNKRLTSTTPYAAVATDYIILMDSTAGAKTVRLPDSPAEGRVFFVKDYAGTAVSNNITVTTVGGVVSIDGATTFVINAAYQSVSIVFAGGGFYSII